MKILVLSASLDPASRSRILARYALQVLRELGEDFKFDVEFVDLQDYPLPLCDGDKAYDNVYARDLNRRLSEAFAIIVAVPVYNFDVNAALKNVIELTGDAWVSKIVSFLCAAGGRSSYMSVMGFANSLMLDFRTLIVPRFVYALGSDFDVEKEIITNLEIRQRTEDLVRETVRLTRAIEPGNKT